MQCLLCTASSDKQSCPRDLFKTGMLHLTLLHRAEVFACTSRVHDLCEVGPWKLHAARRLHHIYAACLTLPQTPRAVVVLLVLLSACICIIETIGQMICWSSCKLSNVESHGMPMCSSASVHLPVPCSHVAVTCTSACSASSCSRTARHTHCSTASNKPLADAPT
jgi:hypothetical protein